ncbi:hypothetical protein MCUN1_000983 [Malassezia cuniculi]|uniref:triacylglycerol lipase n=1 Tax=Malassezia cuniculi TaxID=948313 RepID=A0AAF0EWP3_9BASI|nr:hypothetical protein MCUN1_000983 [Malassezia cuniculi]
MLLHRFAGVLALLAPVFAARPSLVPRAPTDPRSDPFYTPSGDWQSTAPGTILAERTIVPAVASFIDIAVEGYQLLYRTNGVNDSDPSHSVTTILVPQNYQRDKLVSVNVYEDSFSAKCAPSYSVQKGAQLFKDIAFTYQQLFMLTLLNEGWVVVVPDHEGPDVAFTSGFVEGHAVLDSFRATLNYDRLGLSKNARVAGYGYSGGGLATGWAAQLQPSYAPDLNVAGWAMGGVVANISSWFRYLDGTSGAGFVMAGFAGIVESYDQLHWVKDARTSAGRAAWSTAQDLCMYENVRHFSNEIIFSDKYFRNGGTFLNNPEISSVLANLTLGRDSSLAPTAPVYMFHASRDETVPYTMGLSTAQDWCRNGAKVQFSTYTSVFMQHQNTEFFSHPDVVNFLRRRFSNQPFISQCRYDNVRDPWFDPLVLGQSAVQFSRQVLDLITGSVSKLDRVYKYDQQTST